MSDELDKSEGKTEETDETDGDRPTVSPPFDPATFALAKPSPARGTPLVDAHTHATPPQGTAQQSLVELSRASLPPGEKDKKTADAEVNPLVHDQGAPDSIGALAAQKLPSLGAPRIEMPPKKESFSAFNAVDREWAQLEVATRPPPADAPDEDPILEISHDAGTGSHLELDDLHDLHGTEESPTAQVPLVEEVKAAPTPPPPEVVKSPTPAPAAKKPPTEREMNDRISVGDYSGALEIAEALLAEDPAHNAARACADNCRTVLRKMYAARIGPLDRVPSVAVARDQLRWLSIDHKAGFVLSLVDGVSSLEMIIDVSGMPELDTLRILSELAQQRIISLR